MTPSRNNPPPGIGDGREHRFSPAPLLRERPSSQRSTLLLSAQRPGRSGRAASDYFRGSCSELKVGREAPGDWLEKADTICVGALAAVVFVAGFPITCGTDEATQLVNTIDLSECASCELAARTWLGHVRGERR